MSARYQNADEIKQRYIEKMGPDLGAQFAELWQRVVRVHVYWAEFIEMFGTKPGRLDLMNSTAPAFFHMVRGELGDMLLLHLSRLTDKPEMKGQKNLTICNLPLLIKEEPIRTVVAGLVETALEKTKSCRARRNKLIAHNDLPLALKDPKARELDSTTKSDIDEAVRAIGAVLHAVNMHYFESDTVFKRPGARINGVVELLYVIRDGLKAREEREKRIESGQGTDDDFRHIEV
ncbi:MAG TPA: hypothetical protein VGZ49_01660 [Xanthobacteraceae bacterium]|jgi:hypothetical protein|nr:hypothetical protein [Xanthobacteraceae bacterium]